MVSDDNPRGTFPDSKHIKAFDKFLEDVTVPITTECWEALLDSVKEEIALYQTTFRRSLIDVALASEAFAAAFDPNGNNDPPSDSNDLLADDARNAKFLYRLTTFFSCKRCGKLLNYPFDSYHNTYCNKVTYPTRSELAFSESAMVVAIAICNHLGLDVSTRHDSPEYSRGFRCLCCKSGYHRSYSNTWLELVN
jgi:Rieske Fe-S protein